MKLEEVHIGEQLKEVVEEYCSKSGVDKMTIASRLGVTPSALSSIFRSPKGTLENIMKVCAACETSGWKLLARIETNIAIPVWDNFEMILMLDPDDRKFVFKAINSALDLIIVRKKI